MNLDVISPAELVADILKRLGWTGLEWKVVIGPATDAQQQSGVVSVVAAGLPRVELYTPVTWLRAQMRCLHPTLEGADTIAHTVQRDLHQRGRTVARMASTDRRYLIHLCNVTVGPSMHYDSPETWETLLFAELMIGAESLNAT